MKHRKFNTTSAALFLTLSIALVSRAQTPVIENATVNLAKSYISLAGSNFSPTGVAPTVTVGGTTRTVYSFTNTAIVVEVPSTLAAATYLANVTNSMSHSASAYVTVGAVGPQGPIGPTGAQGPTGATGTAGPQGPAGTITLPFSGSAGAPFGPVFALTNTALVGDNAPGPAIAGTGSEAFSGSNSGGAGVGAYGGSSNAGSGGPGLYAVGGGGVAENAVGGIGVNAYGGNAPSSYGQGGNGVSAIGGNGAQTGGDGIYALGGSGSEIGGTGIFAWGGPPGNGDAAIFQGNADVNGNLSKSGGSFKIDHPLDPANKYLYHSFVESPDMMNIYNGNVTTDGSGTAVVSMPAWFEALNTDFRYQLTTIGQPAQAWVASEIANGSFIINTSKSGVKVSWQVTGIRQDAWANAHRIQVEMDKAQPDQGHYLHPELFGHGGEPSIAEMHHPRPTMPAQ